MSNDADTLWRRVREMEAKENFAEAFKCALYLQRMQPTNEEVISTLQRLNARIQKLNTEQNSTENRVRSMLKFIGPEGEKMGLTAEKRVQAANNLVALVRDDAGRKCFTEQKGFTVLMGLMKDGTIKSEVRLALVRVLTELADGSEDLARLVLQNVGAAFLVELMSRSRDETLLTAAQTVLQTMLSRFSGFSPKQESSAAATDPKKRAELTARLKQYEPEIDAIMGAILERINSRVMTGPCRDSLLELLMVNTDYLALDWGLKLVEQYDGLFKLLEVASELAELRYESSMEITGNTRTHVALVLEKVYACCYSELHRELFHQKMAAFLADLLKGAEIESKVRATAAITSLLNGPLDAGNHALGQTGIIEMMLVMANSGDLVQQCVAAEAIIAAASKKDKGKSMAAMGTGILKALYKSSNPKIKVRALVGLCKLGSVGGTDAAAKVFSEESTMKLYEACTALLNGTEEEKPSASTEEKTSKTTTTPKKKGEEDVKKWAADGLAYLSLDADVKEALIDDRRSLAALVELGQRGDLSVLFGVVTTFVNLTNSYDKEELLPELVELAKFSKHHVPEEHEMDAAEFVAARCKALAELHVTAALVALTRSHSKTSRESISRVFNALCEVKELRGQVVQEGGVAALLKLATEQNTDLGKQLAGQALARIAITNDPKVVFRDQRSVEVVGPIMALLHPDRKGLQNFEALMALTNLAQTSPAVRNRILKDGGFASIEQYAYEEHRELRRAAVQCIVNLILSEAVVKYYEAEGSDRTKYLVLLCSSICGGLSDEEEEKEEEDKDGDGDGKEAEAEAEEDVDLETVSAAAGALAMLTSVSPKAALKVFTAKHWLPTLIALVSSKNFDLAHRGVVVVHNLIAASEEAAAKVVEGPLLELLMAIVRPEVDDIPEKIKEVAREALARAEELKLIKNIEKLST